MKLKDLASIILAFSVSIFLSACKSVDEHDHDHHHAEEADKHEMEKEDDLHADEIVLEPQIAARLGVKVSELQPDVFCDVLPVTGEIITPPSEAGVAVAPTSGTVSPTALLAPGRKVSTGAVLGSVSASKISGGDVNAMAREAIASAKRELDRVTPLHQSGIVTDKEYNEVLARYQAAQAAYSPASASGAITAPLAGVITKVLVNSGEYVEAGAPVAEIARTQRLTLRADVPQRYAYALGSITGANIRSAGASHAISLAEHGVQVSGQTGGTAQSGYYPVYLTFENPGSGVAPGMAAEVYLLGRQRTDVLSVPVEAISEQMGSKYVYIRVDDHGYRRMRVETGGSDGCRVEIRSGLSPGDKVVVEGATVIRLAENSGKVPEGHTHNH